MQHTWFIYMCYRCLVDKSCPILSASQTVASQAPLSMGFPRQEYWNGLQFPFPGDLPNPGIELTCPAWQADSSSLSHLDSSIYGVLSLSRHSVMSHSLQPHGLSVTFLCIKVHFSSVAQSCLILCDPMDYNTPGFPALQQLAKLIQTHVHWVDDAIKLSHPLLSPYPPTLNLSQHQGLFRWVSSSHQVAKVLEFQLLHQSFQWIFRTDFL